MTNELIDEYNPETVTHPGVTLAEVLQDRNMTQAELSERSGRPRKTVNEILKGKASITPETALQLERVLGIPASFWNNRQRQHDESVARGKEAQNLISFLPWLKSFPCINDMIKKGWLPPRKNPVLVLDALLAFFGINSPAEWEPVWGKPNLQAALRDSSAYKTNPYALAAYLRQAEIMATAIECKPFDKVRFRRALDSIRSMTSDPPTDLVRKIVALCAETGVAVVFLPLITGVHVSGATRWLSQDRALLALSLRGRTEDLLWFAFFHEAAHLVLHGKSAVFVESQQPGNDAEGAADAYARDLLIPAPAWDSFVRSGVFSKEEEIRCFAQSQGISAAIVVGRLQHERRLPQASPLNRIKRRITFVDDHDVPKKA